MEDVRRRNALVRLFEAAGCIAAVGAVGVLALAAAPPPHTAAVDAALRGFATALSVLHFAFEVSAAVARPRAVLRFRPLLADALCVAPPLAAVVAAFALRWRRSLAFCAACEVSALLLPRRRLRQALAVTIVRSSFHECNSCDASDPPATTVEEKEPEEEDVVVLERALAKLAI